MGSPANATDYLLCRTLPCDDWCSPRAADSLQAEWKCVSIATLKRVTHTHYSPLICHKT